MLITLLFLSNFAFAQTSTDLPALESPSPRSAPRTRGAEDAVRETSAPPLTDLTMGERRERSHAFVLGQLSPIDLVVPMKVGALIGFTESRTVSDEIEYMSSGASASWLKVSVGDFYDRRLSFMRRISGADNSFNFHFGVVVFDSGVTVGNDILSSATGYPTSWKLMHERSLGLELGLGNRWIFKNGITIGIDWASLAQPLVKLDSSSEILNYIKDQGAKSLAEDAFQVLLYFPRISLFKVAAGYTF